MHARDRSLSFLTDGAGFDLALMDERRRRHATWFHFGFRLKSGEAVGTLHDRMQAAGVRIARPLYRDDTLVSYRCADPDGYAIELYWEAADSPK